jgi:hypothetical protein
LKYQIANDRLIPSLAKQVLQLPDDSSCSGIKPAAVKTELDPLFDQTNIVPPQCSERTFSSIQSNRNDDLGCVPISMLDGLEWRRERKEPISEEFVNIDEAPWSFPWRQERLSKMVVSSQD